MKKSILILVILSLSFNLHSTPSTPNMMLTGTMGVSPAVAYKIVNLAEGVSDGATLVTLASIAMGGVLATPVVISLVVKRMVKNAGTQAAIAW